MLEGMDWPTVKRGLSPEQAIAEAFGDAEPTHG